MADTSNGLIYGLAEMKFAGKTIGWIDENGLSPAGNNPTFVEVKAAQVLTGSVASILSDPGSTAFTFNLIQLKAQNLVDILGGEPDEHGGWVPPATVFKEGEAIIKCHSGHSFKIPKAKITRNGFPNGLNMQGVFAYSFRIDFEVTEDAPAGYKQFPPGVDPSTEAPAA